MITVKYFYREPRKTGFSMEGIFKLVRECLAGKVNIEEFYCQNNVSRVKNILLARKFAGEINHITGDVNFLAIGFTGRKNILTIHDFGYYENPVHSKPVKILYHLFWYYLPLKNIDIVTVVSNFTKQKLIKYFGFPVDRIRVIPNPIKAIFKYVEKEKSNEIPVILMMGSGKHKNLDNLIEASKDLQVKLDIIGYPSADEIEKLKKYNISFTVSNNLKDEEVYQHYLNCDIMFCASYYEGFGMPIIEAQAVGRPVITSNIGAMKEVGEGSALLVDPANVVKIKEAILLLNQNKVTYSDLVKSGLKNAEKYSGEIIAQQYLKVYEELYNIKKK